MRAHRLALPVLLLGLGVAAAEGPPPEFFAGDYVLVGQAPDDGATYAGTAVVSARGAGLVVERMIGGEVFRETGAFEVPYPPGEGQVLRLRDGDAVVAGCLWQMDLDNYPRLTCLRGDPSVNERPGYEALFPAPR